MVILCGVDDSAAARLAARGAAALAKRAGEELELLYVQELLLPVGLSLAEEAGPSSVTAELFDAERKRVQAALAPLRDDLSREFGLRVGLRVAQGLPDDQLARAAKELDASLIVVGAIGRRSGSAWRLGSVPDRLSQRAPVPLLVVRDASGFARWAHESRPLRIVVGVGNDSSTQRAVDLAAELARLGPCELVAAHVYVPWREARRLGLGSPEDPATRLEIERALARELPERSGTAKIGAARFAAVQSDGSVAEALCELVEKERADLVLVGTRDHGALERRFLGSVAYGVLGLARASVLIAHGRAAREMRKPRVPAAVRRVLVATDFSELGNRAVDYALALLPKGGQIVLLHVLERPVFSQLAPVPDPLAESGEKRRLERALAEGELRALFAQEGEYEAETEVVEAASTSEAILQAAERHDADLVVLGRSGRGGVAAALIGSTARDVSRSSRRPVLLVPDLGER